QHLRLGRQSRRRGPHSNRRGDENHGAAGIAGAIRDWGRSEVTRQRHSIHTLRRVPMILQLTVAALLALSAPQPVWAQMAGTPSAGYKREVGMPASAMPEALREIG